MSSNFRFLTFITHLASKVISFSLYILKSRLQCHEFCVHSCVTRYAETRAEQAFFLFSKKISSQNLSKSVIIIKSHFTSHFYSKLQHLDNTRDCINKNRNLRYSF